MLFKWWKRRKHNKKAAAKLRQLLNDDFSEKDLKVKISYSNCGDKAASSLLTENK